MKPALLFFFILFSPVVTAQTTFAPLGAEWYNNMGYGVFHTYTDLDTVIMGIPCHRVRQTANELPYWTNLGLTVHNLSNIYVYNNPDTVFVYNTFFSKFTPLYIYNVHAGDTLKLPILPLVIGSFNISSTDSTFWTVIDSVKQVLYDTTTLKTIYTHPVQRYYMGYPAGFVYAYGSNITGSYIEKIGSVHGMLMPGCSTCSVPATESIPNIGSLRCYNDTGLAIKMIAGICGNPPVQVKVLTNLQISIYPVPAVGYINITGIPDEEKVEVIFTNMNGKEVYHSYKTLIPIFSLPDGIYIARIIINDGSSFYKRVVVLH